MEDYNKFPWRVKTEDIDRNSYQEHKDNLDGIIASGNELNKILDSLEKEHKESNKER